MRRLTKCQSNKRLQQRWLNSTQVYKCRLFLVTFFFFSMWIFPFSFHAPQPHSSRVFLSHFCQEQTCPSHVHDGKNLMSGRRGFHIGCNASHLSGSGPLKQTPALTPKPGFHYFPRQGPHKPSASTHCRVCCVRVCPAFAPVPLSTGRERADSFQEKGHEG